MDTRLSVVGHPVALPPCVDAYTEQVLRDWSVRGASVCVVQPDKIILERGYGVLEHERPQRADEHSLFGLGSTSKTFTAEVVGRLVDQGLKNWDDV